MRRLLLLLLGVPAFAAAQDRCLRHAIDAADTGFALQGQIVVTALGADGRGDTQVLAPPGQAKLKGDEGFRIASITKTFVAATVLKLWEEGRIDLEAPIARWLPGSWTRKLADDGYRPSQIEVRHLLGHTSGLADHAQAEQFIAAIKADPSIEWSRARDIDRLVEWTDPVAAPGEKFSYSDTGYVLLGAIVEEITGQDLPDAVRTQLGLDRLGLENTYWERYEPTKGRRRAHQVFEGQDTYTWNPSLDLFGGGGLVASTQDVARFFDALLQGRVFSKPETLQRMLSKEGLPDGSPYRLGVFDYDLKGARGIGHSGFWGTLVMRDAISGRTIAGAVTDRADYPKLHKLAGDYIRTAAGPDAEAAGCR